MVVTTMEDVFDLVVIGSGIIGANIFYRASILFPDWKILILDKENDINGASLYSAGLDVPIGRNKWHSQLTLNSRKFYQQYIREIPNLAINSLKSYFIVPQNMEEDFHKKNIGKFVRANSHELSYLECKLDIRLKRNELVFTQSDNSYGNVKRVIKSLIRAGETKEKNNYIKNFEVQSIEQIDTDLCLLKTLNKTSILTRRVTTAVGPWIHHNLYSAISEAIRIKKIVVLHVTASVCASDPLVFL